MENIYHPLNRIKGSIVGYAIGDAIGASLEFQKTPKEQVTDFIPSPRKGLNAGQFTDDTQHLCLSLDSLIENEGEIIIDDIATRLKSWYRSGKARSIGRTTELAILNLIKGIDPKHSGINNPGSCGSLGIPRLIPYCLLSALLSYERKLSTSDEKNILGITHSHKDVFRMGSLIHYYLQEIMYGKTPLEVTTQIVDENEFLNRKTRKKLGVVLGLADSPVDPKVAIYTIGNTGYVEDVVYSSIYSSIKGKDFKEAVLFAVNGLGDSDSRGGLTGALKGLSVGYSQLPQEWKTNVEDSSMLQEKAIKLYRLSI